MCPLDQVTYFPCGTSCSAMKGYETSNVLQSYAELSLITCQVAASCRIFPFTYATHVLQVKLDTNTGMIYIQLHKYQTFQLSFDLCCFYGPGWY